MANDKGIERDETVLDAVLEDEVRRGWRVLPVPSEIQTELQGSDIPAFQFVRMTRLNMARRRKITELVQRAYHKDIQDKDLLSNAQVMKLVSERGEWTDATEERLKDLGDRTTGSMMNLYQEGVSRSHEWAEQLGEYTDKVLDAIDACDKPDAEKEILRKRFLRWQQYTPDRQIEYVEAFAADIADWGGVYFPDKDMGWLQDNLPTIEAADCLEDIQGIVDKIFQYLQLVRDRAEYETLRVRRLQIFANTVESRRENAQEMARVFHTCEVCTEDGTPTGPLVREFDKLYEFPDAVLEWLVEEQFYFHNGITNEQREFLRTFGFTRAETEKTTEPAPPEESVTPSSGEPGPSAPSGELPEASKASTVSPLSTGTLSSSSA